MFTNRTDAGMRLAERLDGYIGRSDVVVVGLPRGGVPVAAEVARRLGVALDVIIVRKLGVPYYPEVALGAIGEGGVRFIDDSAVRSWGVTQSQLDDVENSEHAELLRRTQRLRGIRPRRSLAENVVIVVDDGVATGSTARAACQVARAGGAARVVLAVPVAPADWTATLDGVADEFVAVETPRSFDAVGSFYDDFSATTDDEVVSILQDFDA